MGSFVRRSRDCLVRYKPYLHRKSRLVLCVACLQNMDRRLLLRKSTETALKCSRIFRVPISDDSCYCRYARGNLVSLLRSKTKRPCFHLHREYNSKWQSHWRVGDHACRNGLPNRTWQDSSKRFGGFASRHFRSERDLATCSFRREYRPKDGGRAATGASGFTRPCYRGDRILSKCSGSEPRPENQNVHDSINLVSL